MYCSYLREKREDQFWRGVLNNSYETLDSSLEVVKSDMERNRFEMKQSISSNLNDYVKSQESATKLTSELNRIKSNLRGQDLKMHISQFRFGKSEDEIPKDSFQAPKIILSDQSLFEKFKKCQKESDFMEIFEVEKVIQRCLKAEEYDELSRLLFWLDSLIEKNVGRTSLHGIFSGIMRKYRKVLCNVLFSTYSKQKKQKLLKFFIDFGKQLKSQKDLYLFEIFQAHFAKRFKGLFEISKTQLIMVNHVANVVEIYGKALNKSILFVQKVNDSIREGEQINLLRFVNRFRKNLIDLIDKIKVSKMNEIKIKLSLFQEPLKTHIRLGSIKQLQLSSQTKAALQKVKAYMRYDTSLELSISAIEIDNITQRVVKLQETLKSVKFLAMISNTMKIYRFILAFNQIEAELQNQFAQEFQNKVFNEAISILKASNKSLTEEQEGIISNKWNCFLSAVNQQF